MLLDHTLRQLDRARGGPSASRQAAQLGYMQWIAALPGSSDHAAEARHALDRAEPFVAHAPAIAAFCELLLQSINRPLTPLPLALPPRRRRGGARGRRAAT